MSCYNLTRGMDTPPENGTVVMWKGQWNSGYPGVTGVMKVPLYTTFTENYSTYCDNKYTGWYSKGTKMRLDIEVTMDPDAIYPTLVSYNGKQEIRYKIDSIYHDDTQECDVMEGVYTSKSPSDKGSFKLKTKIVKTCPAV
jgi:hypothetical protein